LAGPSPPTPEPPTLAKLTVTEGLLGSGLEASMDLLKESGGLLPLRVKVTVDPGG
jgi:hypothetical protein